MLNVHFEQRLIILLVSPVLLEVMTFCPFCNLKRVQRIKQKI